MWKQLNENIDFKFIIFSCTSKKKSDTYKKVENCKVICYDFKIDEDSRIKGIQPQKVDCIENIFEEIYSSIQKHRPNKK